VPSRSFGHHGFKSHHGAPHRFRNHGFVGGFGSFGALSSPFVVYATPPYDSGAPAYAPPPVYYGAPMVSAPPVTSVMSIQPAPPPRPNVEHSTGRYELRGDGIATPYAWVWVPNPPPPPSGPPPAEESGKPRRQDLYRWTDEQGVLHLTDRLETVPPEHRGRAKPPS
jgi:hypothetical protein